MVASSAFFPFSSHKCLYLFQMPEIVAMYKAFRFPPRDFPLSDSDSQYSDINN